MDNIAIWSNTVNEHMENVATILWEMLDNKLYLNSKKSDLFIQEIHFLGHPISACGIEPDDKKTNRVTNWPTPKHAKHVQAFLGLMQYISPFLLNLANYMSVLDELTTKDCNKVTAPWTDRHEAMFRVNYPVHEKELLAIVHALAKWQTDLLGYTFEVWTDHRTLEHFGTQCNLSHWQAQWMEFTLQYDTNIHYLAGEQNSVADTLS